MDEDYNKIGFLIVLCLIVALVFLLKKYIKDKKHELAQRVQARRLQGTVALVLVLGIVIRFCLNEKVMGTYVKPENCEEANLTQPTPDVWNISGRVAQDGVVGSDSQRWPTHDHRISIDSFVLPNGVHISNKDRMPPPLYSEVDLPTYEQATGCSLPKTELSSVHVSSSGSRSLDNSHS